MAAVGSGEVQAAFHDGNSFRDSAEDGFCFCRVCPEFQVSRSGFGQGRAVGQRVDGGGAPFSANVDFVKLGEGCVLEVRGSKASLEFERPVSPYRRSGASSNDDAAFFPFCSKDASFRQRDEYVASYRAAVACPVDVAQVGPRPKGDGDAAANADGQGCGVFRRPCASSPGAAHDHACEGGASVNGDAGVSVGGQRGAVPPVPERAAHDVAREDDSFFPGDGDA